MQHLADHASMPALLSADPTRTEEAFEELFETARHSLWRLAIRMTSDPDLASDLVQECFLRALRKGLPEGEPAARAWLNQTLVNLCRDRHRWAAVRRVAADKASEAVAIGSSVDPEAGAIVSQTLDRALAELPPRRRALLLLHELEGESIDALAETFGLRPMTVRWHLAQAKKSVLKLLSDERGRRKDSTDA